MLRFLYRCCRRLEKLGFTYESPVYKAVDKAYDGLHSLHIELHYIACGTGVWKSSEEQTGSTGPTDQAPTEPSRPDG
jgi:hypothetical protein